MAKIIQPRTMVTAALFLHCCMTQVFAQETGRDYPTKPIKIILGFGAGGASDVTARLVAQKLSERLGQQVLIENRPSAGGIVAAEAVARSQPDGHTLLLIAAANAISTSLFKYLPYDIKTDFSPISTLSFFTFAFATKSDSKLASIKDLISYGKANPNKLSIGTTAIGGGQHLAAELFKSMSGLDAQTVPFNSTPAALTALRGGDIDLVVENLPPVYGPIKAGNLKVLAVTSSSRFQGLASVPTVAESGYPGYQADTWNALVAPAKTPGPVIARLNREIESILREPDLVRKLLDLGLEAKSSTPNGLRDLLTSEIEKWRGVIEKAQIQKQ